MTKETKVIHWNSTYLTVEKHAAAKQWQAHLAKRTHAPVHAGPFFQPVIYAI
jgi:hypothetical protein